MLTLRAGLEAMMRCRHIEPAMMRCSPVGIPLEVSSLADEVLLLKYLLGPFKFTQSKF